MSTQQFFLAHGETLGIAGFAVLFVILAVAERAAPARPDVPRGRRWLTNFAITALAGAALALLPISLVGAALWAEGRDLGLLRALALPLPVVVAVTLLLRALISWFIHFANHKVPLLWRLHRVHHLDRELDVSTTARFHPLEQVVGFAIAGPAVVLLGLSPWVLALYELLDALVNVFSHANLRLPDRLERALGWVIVTPRLHRIHHSSWQPETDSNYGAVFPIWDLLLGTRRTATRQPDATMTLGLDEVRDDRADRAGWLLASPYVDLRGR